eukprot:102068_1
MRTSRCSALDRRAIQFTSSKQDTTRNRSDQGVPMIRYVMSIWAIIVVVFNFGPSLILCAGNDDLNDGPCGIKAKRVGKQIANLRCDYQELLYTLRRFGAIHYDWAVQSSAVSKKLKLSWPVQWGSLKTLLRSGCSIVPTEPPEVRTLDGLVNAFPVPPGYELVILQDRLADVTLPALPGAMTQHKVEISITENGNREFAYTHDWILPPDFGSPKYFYSAARKFSKDGSTLVMNLKDYERVKRPPGTLIIVRLCIQKFVSDQCRDPPLACYDKPRAVKVEECVKCKVRKSEENQLKKCSRCREPLYCSRKCQKIHWKKTYRNHCVEYSED